MAADKRSRRHTRHGVRGERRSGMERRSGRDRRQGSSMHELYQTDLDRHLWAFAGGKRRKRKGARRRRRRVARFVAGALSVAGVAYYLYRRWQGEEAGADHDRPMAQAEEQAAEDREDEHAGV